MGLTALPQANPPPSLLRNRSFVLLWCAYAISALGDHLSEMAILKTQNALDEGVDITQLAARMSFVFFAAFFLVAPLAGVLADRLPRRLLMIAADLIRCGLFLGFASLIGWFEVLGTWGAFLPLLPIGMLAAVFSPARAALLPTLIQPQQLVRANGLISGLGIIATMAAVGLGGYLADNYDARVSFRLDAFTYLASALCLVFLRPPRGQVPTERPARRSKSLGGLAAGVRYVRTHRRVLELIALAAVVWFCGALVKSVIPAVVRDVYGGTYQTISGYYALLGAGFVIGAIGITTLGNALRSEIALTWGLLGISVGMALLGASVFLALPVATLRVIGGVGIVIGGASACATMASFNTLLQRIVPNRFRGRVFGVKDVSAIGALLLATGALGVPAWERVDTLAGFILALVSILTFIAAAITLTVRLRRSPFPPQLTLARNINDLIAKFWWRLERVGPSTVPAHGPVIVTANHVSAPDPNFLIAASNRRVLSFIIAEEYIRWPVVRTCHRLLHCIAAKRDGRDTMATKQALRQLRAGGALGIFIEGGIPRPGVERIPKDGVAMLALRTGATVIPVHISGVTYRHGIFRGLLSRYRARVRFGRPVDLSEFERRENGRETLRAATRKIWAAIQALAPTEEPGTCQHPPGAAGFSPRGASTGEPSRNHTEPTEEPPR